jgi:hypothetical protein
MNWTEMKAQEFKFQEKGDHLQGRILDSYETRYGMGYDLKDAHGEQFYFFGSAQLDRKLADSVGKTVFIAFLGMIETRNGRMMKDFEVQFLKDESSEWPDEVKTPEAI